MTISLSLFCCAGIVYVGVCGIKLGSTQLLALDEKTARRNHHIVKDSDCEQLNIYHDSYGFIVLV
jgi:hypothetical protein